ncbi:MAG: sulfatase-like hydrolase/transferase [Planctomycetales bacterium]
MVVDQHTRHSSLLWPSALIAALLIASGATNSMSADSPRPNLVFILSDDQLRDSFGCYGSDLGLTPHVDRLAADGVRFTRACVTTPVCAPSRISCLTGRYAGRFMPYVLNTGAHFPSTQPTVATYLKAAGYRTAIIGKLHFHLRDVPGREPLPEQMRRLGFDEAEHVHRANFNKGAHLEGQERDFAAAREFIEKNKDRPFALFLFTTLTHGPVEAPQKYIDMVPAGPNRTGRAMYRWLDELTGELVGTLEKNGLRDRTAIVFAGDNAPSQDGGSTGSRNKGTLYDGWVPLVVSFPGRIRKGAVVDEVVQNIDYLPTILDLCGIPLPEKAKVDGRSFVPLLEGKPVAWREEAYFEVDAGRAVRTDRWKYIAFRPTAGMPRPLEKQLSTYDGKADLLFDLRNDPVESRNLAADPDHAATLAEMRGRLKKLCAGYEYRFGEFGSEPPDDSKNR